MSRFQLGRTLRLGVGIGITALFVYLISRNVNAAELIAAVRRAHAEWIAVAVALFLAGFACRIARWRVMLAKDNPDLRWRDCAIPMMGSVAANNVLPFRAGDILRVFGFSRRLKVPTAMMLASLLVERLLDLFCLLLFLSVFLFLVEFDRSALGVLARIGAVGIFSLALLIGLFLLFPYILEAPARGFLRVASKFSTPIAERVARFVDRLFAALRHLSRGPTMASCLGWSAVAWSLEGTVFWATARAVPDMVNPMAAWLAFPVSTLATLLPSSPGYVGTFDFFAIRTVEAMGNPVVAATAFALLVHLVLWLPATLIGGAGLAFLSLDRSSVDPLKDARIHR